MANEKGLINYNDKWIPSSHSFRFIDCGDPTCNHVHIIGESLAGEPIFEMTLDEEQLREALEIAQRNK